jgi:Zeta toxin
VHACTHHTAGAMGAGKSHVIQWMSANGCFPLPDIVQIDPDLFKIGFPEWDAYVKADPLKVRAYTTTALQFFSRVLLCRSAVRLV